MKRSGIIIFLLVLNGIVPLAGFASAEESAATPKQGKGDASSVERLLMGGTEIRGTVEKPHVVYIVPWREGAGAEEREIPFERSFKEEILAPVDKARFQAQWGSVPKARKEAKSNE